MFKLLNYLLIFNLVSSCFALDALTPLMIAVNNNDLNEVSLLIRSGVNVNAHTGDDWSAGETALMMAAKKCNIEIMKVLINAGADVNAVAFSEQPHAGNPVLRYALDARCLPAVQLLVEHNVDVNEATEGKLLEMIKYKTNKYKPVRNISLLSYAISIDLPIEFIKTLLDAKPNLTGIKFKWQSIDWTPLMIAAYKGNKDVVGLLLDLGADVSLKNEIDNKRTALDYAKMQGHKEIVKILEDQKKILNLKKEVME